MKTMRLTATLALLSLLTACAGTMPKVHVTEVTLNDGKPLEPGTYMVDTQTNPDGGGSIDQLHWLLRVENDGTQHWINAQNTAGPKDIHVLGNTAIQSGTGLAITILNNKTDRSIANTQADALIESTKGSAPGLIILNAPTGGEGGDATAGTQTEVGVQTEQTSVDHRPPAPPMWIPKKHDYDRF